jgi:hypothetical protein
MGKDKELYDVVEYILNSAGERELEVIKEALKRRIEKKQHSPMGIDINRIAHESGNALSRELSSSKDYIRNSVKDFVIKTIRAEAPEISNHDLEVLLDQWVPDPGKIKKTENKNQLPSDAVIKMIDQFLRFSTGEMAVGEQAELNRSMSDWQENYWNHFPNKIRGLISLYLKGKIDSGTCWDEIEKELYNE